MSSHRPEHEERVALYALGMLEDAERDRIEAHLADCDHCRRELALRRGEMVLLADLAELEEPSEGVLEGLMARIGDENSSAAENSSAEHGGGDKDGAAAEGAAVPGEADRFSPDRSSPVTLDRPGSTATRAAWGLALAATLLVALLGWSLAVQRSLRGEVERMAQRNRSLQGQLDQRVAELDGMRTRLASTRSALRATSAAPLAVLAGLEDVADARARLYRDGASGAVLLVVDALPEAPADRVYQLWGIVDGRPVPAGVFNTSADGAGYLLTEAPATGPVQVWAVTEEPPGGVPQPTGQMVLKS